MQKNLQRGEVATIVTLGTLLVLGVSTLISSVFVKNNNRPQTMSTKAQEACSNEGGWRSECLNPRERQSCAEDAGVQLAYRCEGGKWVYKNPECSTQCKPGAAASPKNPVCEGKPAGTIINDCLRPECDTNIGKKVCIEQFCDANGSLQEKPGSITTESCSVKEGGTTCQKGKIADYCARSECDSKIGYYVCIDKVWGDDCKLKDQVGSQTATACTANAPTKTTEPTIVYATPVPTKITSPALGCYDRGEEGRFICSNGQQYYFNGSSYFSDSQCKNKIDNLNAFCTAKVKCYSQTPEGETFIVDDGKAVCVLNNKVTCISGKTYTKDCAEEGVGWTCKIDTCVAPGTAPKDESWFFTAIIKLPSKLQGRTGLTMGVTFDEPNLIKIGIQAPKNLPDGRLAVDVLLSSKDYKKLGLNSGRCQAKIYEGEKEIAMTNLSENCFTQAEVNFKEEDIAVRNDEEKSAAQRCNISVYTLSNSIILPYTKISILNNNSVIEEGESDSKGFYKTTKQFNAGSYKITAKKDGYTDSSKDLKVDPANNACDVKLVMTPVEQPKADVITQCKDIKQGSILVNCPGQYEIDTKWDSISSPDKFSAKQYYQTTCGKTNQSECQYMCQNINDWADTGEKRNYSVSCEGQDSYLNEERSGKTSVKPFFKATNSCSYSVEIDTMAVQDEDGNVITWGQYNNWYKNNVINGYHWLSTFDMPYYRYNREGKKTRAIRAFVNVKKESGGDYFSAFSTPMVIEMKYPAQNVYFEIEIKNCPS